MTTVSTTSSKRGDSAYAQLHKLRTIPSTGIDAEKMCAHYLTASGQFKWALRWDDLKLYGPYRWTGVECGIDVVAEHIDGTIWAIQVKDYDRRVGLRAYNDLDTFVREGARHGVKFGRRAIFCASSGPTPRLRDRCTATNVVVYTRRDCKDVGWPSTIAELDESYKQSLHRKPIVHEGPRKPRSWQPRMLKAVHECLLTRDRCRVYAVPGAGKTDAFIRLADDYETVAVIVPNLNLAAQTYKNFIRFSKVPYTNNVLFVCSKLDSDDLRSSDLPTQHTTDPAAVAAFMRRPGRKLIVGTYHSSHLLTKHHLDLAIFDEAHHMAEFRYKNEKTKRAEALLRSHNITHRVFFTGTEKVYSAEIKRFAHNRGHYIASLDNPKLFGPLAFNFNYYEALTTTETTNEKIVKRYVVHWVHIKDRRVRKLAKKAKNVRDTETAKRERTLHMLTVAGINSVKADYQYLSHSLVFTNSIDNADHMRNLYRNRQPTEWAKTISSREPTDVSLDRLEEFRSAPKALATNVNSLGEGIDVPGIDVVAIADPMQSVHAIAQKILRGIRYDHTKSPQDNVLHVVVPCDIEDGWPTLASYHMIANVLGALGEVDYTLKQEIQEIASNTLGPGREPRFRVPANLPNLDPVKLAKVVSTMVYSPISVGWHLRYAQLKKYLETHNGKYPTQRPTSLGGWVTNQRAAYRGRGTGTLSTEQVALLEALPGWSWQEKFAVEGTCQVPCGCDKKAIKRIDDLVVCGVHYGQWQRHRDEADFEYFPIRHVVITGACQAPCGCANEAARQANGLMVCRTHYAQWHRNRDRPDYRYKPIRPRQMQGSCQVPCGCNRKAVQQADGVAVCGTHYVQWNKHHNQADFRYKPIRETIRGTCQAPCGCGNKADSRADGLPVCGAHWGQWHRHHDEASFKYEPLRVVLGGTCQAPCGCDGNVRNRVNGLPICDTHYSQWRKGRDRPDFEYKPIKRKPRSRRA
jgi:superfamily II DNA or RNA helicase